MRKVALSDAAHRHLAEYAHKLKLECSSYLHGGSWVNGVWVFPSGECRTPADAKRLYIEEARRVMGEALFEASPDDEIVIECATCKTRTTVHRTLRTFRCNCSRDHEQYTYKQRVMVR